MRSTCSQEEYQAMTKPTVPAGLTIENLFSRYLEEQTEAHTKGLGYPETIGDAVPHDMAPVQPIDPKLAWGDAVAALGVSLDVPEDWPNLVNQAEPAVSLAFALGNYPQQVRHVAALLMTDPGSLQEKAAPGADRPTLMEWANGQKGDAARLLAAGVLRVARLFDAAANLLSVPVGEALAGVRGNECAALMWHRGEREAALATWRKLPDSLPVLFNRGMALLFTGDAAEASKWLAKAQEGLPETSAWHHLAGLYLAMASGMA
jgi:hypothetical protein